MQLPLGSLVLSSNHIHNSPGRVGALEDRQLNLSPIKHLKRWRLNLFDLRLNKRQMIFYSVTYLLECSQTAWPHSCPLLSGFYGLYLVFTVSPLVVLGHPLLCALNNLFCNATPGAVLDLLLLAEGPR